jgi:hypothetical protein
MKVAAHYTAYAIARRCSCHRVNTWQNCIQHSMSDYLNLRAAISRWQVQFKTGKDTQRCQQTTVL